MGGGDCCIRHVGLYVWMFVGMFMFVSDNASLSNKTYVYANTVNTLQQTTNVYVSE